MRRREERHAGRSLQGAREWFALGRRDALAADDVEKHGRQKDAEQGHADGLDHVGQRRLGGGDCLPRHGWLTEVRIEPRVGKMGTSGPLAGKSGKRQKLFYAKNNALSPAVAGLWSERCYLRGGPAHGSLTSEETWTCCHGDRGAASVTPEADASQQAIFDKYICSFFGQNLLDKILSAR